MKRRIFAVVLVVLLIFAMTACSNNNQDNQNNNENNNESVSNNNNNNEENNSQNDNNEQNDNNDEENNSETKEIKKIIMAFPTWTGAPADLMKIQDAMNEISREKIGVEAELLVIDFASYNQQMTLMLTGSEQLDIISTVGYPYITAVQNGQLLDLEENDLIQNYGQGIVDAVGEQYVDACRVDGVLYGVPNSREFAQGRGCAAVRTDLLQEIGYEFKDEGEIEHISIEKLNEIYASIHESRPDLEVYRPVEMSMLQFSNVDALGGNEFGVLLNYGAELEVENLFESDYYMEYATRMRDYYNKGYISQDAATDTTAVGELVKAGTLASYTTGGKPGIKAQESNLCGMDMTIFQTMGDYISSNAVAQFPWAIPINTVDEVAAMKYMDLMFTDATMMNIISWGIEGEHYEMQENGLINFPEGVDATNSGYIHSMGWMFFNQLITHVWEGNDPDVWDQIRTFNKEAKKSAAMGFTFNPSNVATEMTAVQNVYDEYQKSIEFGLVEPETGISELLEKMENAGLDKIIEEKQIQLDAWAEKQ